MAAVQMICADLGMVSGRGLAQLLRKFYPRWVWPACVLLAVANVANIGADLGGMSAATSLVTGIKPYYFPPIYTTAIVCLLLWSSYRHIATIFKWMTPVLLAYVVTAFLAKPDWPSVLRATLLPQLQWSNAYLSVFVAVIGTSISPYLFFWQATQEVEEDRDKGRTTVEQRKGATRKELRFSRQDVISGMSFSQGIMFFIILTTAATLHTHGVTQISSAQQAAEALRPLAGNGAYVLFTLGIVGTGMLSVPVLAGSTAYAISEAAAWRNSLKDRPRTAPRFYMVLGASMVLGLVVNYFGFGAVQMLFWSAVINGVLAPPLIILVVLLSSNPRVLGKRVSHPAVRALGWLAAAVMAGAAVAMLITL